MKKKDLEMLEEAYLSIGKKTATEANPMSEEPVNVGPMDEPAPGIEMSVADEPGLEATASTEVDPTQIDQTQPSNASPIDVNLGQEDEEDQMTLDNLNSVRESIVKIAGYCGSGGHLETWAQQKLAIAMDNLAEVARRLH